MSKLRDMPNVGAILERRLASVDIADQETLRELGSRQTFLLLYQHEGDTCLSTLCALEGAIRGIRWHDLPREEKLSLKSFFDEHTGKKPY